MGTHSITLSKGYLRPEPRAITEHCCSVARNRWPKGKRGWSLYASALGTTSFMFSGFTTLIMVSHLYQNTTEECRSIPWQPKHVLFHHVFFRPFIEWYCTRTCFRFYITMNKCGLMMCNRKPPLLIIVLYCGASLSYFRNQQLIIGEEKKVLGVWKIL